MAFCASGLRSGVASHSGATLPIPIRRDPWRPNGPNPAVPTIQRGHPNGVAFCASRVRARHGAPQPTQAPARPQDRCPDSEDLAWGLVRAAETESRRESYRCV